MKRKSVGKINTENYFVGFQIFRARNKITASTKKKEINKILGNDKNTIP